MAAKKIEITYTPEELAEIDRIIRVITEEPPAFEQPVQPQVQKKAVAPAQPEEEFDIEHYDTEIPSDLSFEDEFGEPAAKGKRKEDIEEIEEFEEPEFPDEERELDELSNIHDEEIEDITDIITEAEDPRAAAAEEVLNSVILISLFWMKP
jgi:hypothetical protein